VLGAVEAAPHDKPLVLVGHSLGGVILFDLLASGRVQRPVHALVTAGSQAPFFYKCDASETLRLGDSGRPFTPWLNLYDRNDMLSFLAVSSFASTPGIRDVEVRSGAPFPASHGAYWRLPEVYQEIAAVCP
jgi:pimeloyl-ACP methyl ester carboxylesterase